MKRIRGQKSGAQIIACALYPVSYIQKDSASYRLIIESLESRADAVQAVCRVFPPVFLNIKGKRVGKEAQRPAGVGTFTKNAAG